MKTAILCFILACVASTSANAAFIKFDFTASGITDCCFNLPTSQAPQDLVSGNLIWEADSVDAEIRRIVSIDLEIDGEVFTLGEIG